MAVKFLEPGGDAAGLGLLDANAGAPVTATDFVHGTHVNSIKYPTGAAGSNGKKGVLSDTGGRMSFYIYINAQGNATCSILDTMTTGFGTAIFVLRLTTTGVLQLFSSGVQLGTDGATLSAGAWHRISIAWTVTSTTSFNFKAWVDGTLCINNASTGSLAAVGNADFIMGNVSGNATLDIRLSDLYVDDSSSLTDTGDVWVTAKRPNANGTSNQFTTQIGASGSGYGTGHAPQVNERPPSDTNGWSLSTTTKVTEEYNIEPKATGDINIASATILDFMGWIRAALSTTANSPVNNLILAGVATPVTLTATAAYYTKVAGSSTYPPGSGADIGMDAQYTTTAGVASLYEAGIVVAYTPASGAITSHNLALLGVGI